MHEYQDLLDGKLGELPVKYNMITRADLKSVIRLSTILDKIIGKLKHIIHRWLRVFL